jgi:hypothetical protein
MARKMLAKLATHNIQDVSALFSLAEKCARAVEGHAWHSLAAQAVKEDNKPNAGTQAQSGSNGNNNNNKKKAGGNQSLAGTPTTALAAAAVGGGRGLPRGDKCPRQPSNSNDGSSKCLVHNSRCHNMSECREIKKLTEEFCEKMQL